MARTSEVRFATFDEIDGDVWELSEERTKNGRLHRIPLTQDALEIVSKAKRTASNDLLFPTARGAASSDAALAMFLKREGFKAQPHGFRASFGTWVEEQTEAPFEVKEACLGHAVDSKIVEAYRRSDRLEKRRALLIRWAEFLGAQ